MRSSPTAWRQSRTIWWMPTCAGELAAEARDRFQSYYLSSSRRREKVNFAEALLALPVPNAVAERVQRTGAKVAKFDFSPALAVAACLALLGAGLFLYQNSQLRNELVRSQQKTAVLERSEREARNQIEGQAQTAKTASGLAIVLLPQLRGAAPLPLSPFTLEASRPISNWNSSREILRSIGCGSGFQPRARLSGKAAY